MLSIFGFRRAQIARNRRKAETLIAEHGDAAAGFVEQKLAATMWRVRDHAHWQRIEKQVKALLDR
jgi:hypothetical protein